MLTFVNNAVRPFAVILLSLICLIFIGAPLTLILPGEFAQKAIWLTIAMPLIWTFLIIYSCWDAKRWRVYAVMIALIIISAILIAITPAPF